MKSNILRKVNIIIFVLICSVLFFKTAASAFERNYSFNIFSKTESDFSSSPVEINIVSPQIILQGREMQMEFETPASGVYVPVEWSSSNPDVISCTKDGKITGNLKGKTRITVEAKNSKSSDSITVYCAKKFKEPETASVRLPFFWINKTPAFFNIEKIKFNFGMLFFCRCKSRGFGIL